MAEAIHELKTTKVPFQATWEGKKNYEVRKNDRNFKVGDILVLVEVDTRRVGGCACGNWQKDEMYRTGRAITCRVTYITTGNGLTQEHIVMGIKDLDCKSSYFPLTIKLL